MTRRAPRRPAAAARQGAQVHGARAGAGACAGHRGFTVRDAARDRRHGRRPVSATTCCSRTRPSTRPARARWPTSGARVTVAVDSRRDDRRRGRQRHPRGAHRRQRRHAPLRLPAGRRRRARRPRARTRASTCAASWATRATRSGSPIAPNARAKTAQAMATARGARAERSAATSSPAGGTGTFDINTVATEIQAGSYALMDTAYGELGLPFAPRARARRDGRARQPKWAVADCGLKALGHGPRQPDDRRGATCGSAPTSTSRSRPSDRSRVGDRVLRPARARRPDRRVPRVVPPRRRTRRWTRRRDRRSGPSTSRGWDDLKRATVPG